MPCRGHRAAQLPQIIGIRAPGGSGIVAAGLDAIAATHSTHTAMRRLWLGIVTYAAALLENDTRPLCRDVRIHDDPKKREGYGNQIHALVFAAEFARSCGLRVAIPRTGRFGVICSRLGCNAPHVDRRDFGESQRRTSRRRMSEAPALDARRDGRATVALRILAASRGRMKFHR